MRFSEILGKKLEFGGKKGVIVNGFCLRKSGEVYLVVGTGKVIRRSSFVPLKQVDLEEMKAGKQPEPKFKLDETEWFIGPSEQKGTMFEHALICGSGAGTTAGTASLAGRAKMDAMLKGPLSKGTPGTIEPDFKKNLLVEDWEIDAKTSKRTAAVLVEKKMFGKGDEITVPIAKLQTYRKGENTPLGPKPMKMDIVVVKE